MSTRIDNDTATSNNSGTGSDESSGGRFSGTTDKVRDKAGAAREKASAAYASARDRTSSAYSSTRDKASSATRRTAEGIDANPMGALIGGLAIGGLLAAVLPKTRREAEMLGPVGRRINETAREATKAAQEAGRDKLDELGYNRDTAKQKLTDLADGARETIKTSAGAAAQTVKGSQQQ